MFFCLEPREEWSLRKAPSRYPGRFRTDISALIARNFFSLIPSTSKRCSFRRNIPNFSLCTIIFSAVFAPMPGSRSRSSDEAVLISIACGLSGVAGCEIGVGRAAQAEMICEKQTTRSARKLRI